MGATRKIGSDNMGNVCINTVNVQGTSKQADDLVKQMTETFGDSIDMVDDFATEAKGYATLTLCSSWQMPQKELLEVTNSLLDTEGLYIRVISEEPEEEYFEQSIFRDGKWTFENPPSIKEQISALTAQGLEQIRGHIKEKGNIDFGEDCTWCALYVNDDGYAECPYFRLIELETDGKLSVLLSDGHWLYEGDLATTHIMDILDLLFEEHGTANE